MVAGQTATWTECRSSSSRRRPRLRWMRMMRLLQSVEWVKTKQSKPDPSAQKLKKKNNVVLKGKSDKMPFFFFFFRAFSAEPHHIPVSWRRWRKGLKRGGMKPTHPDRTRISPWTHRYITSEIWSPPNKKKIKKNKQIAFHFVLLSSSITNN